MFIALTGTPGTGKTTIAKILEKKYKVIYLKNFEDVKIGYDKSRGSYIVDIEKLKKKVKEIEDDEKMIIEGHYSHDMPVDIVIVLRCHPEELKKRLEKRGYKEKKIRENMEAEAMNLITSEAIIKWGKDKVFEVDTTKKSPRKSAEEVIDIIEKRDKRYGARINYAEEILKWY